MWFSTTPAGVFIFVRLVIFWRFVYSNDIRAVRGAHHLNIPEVVELYALYRADLYRYLCRLTRDSAAAEDLLSETFLRALKGAVTFRGESGVKTWLFTIARNAWCESLRRQHPTVSTDELVTAQYLADDTLHTHTETRALLHRVRELLDGYGDRPRDIVLLRAQGYSYAEIAARLDITENSARVIEHRTRARLRADLTKEGYE